MPVDFSLDKQSRIVHFRAWDSVTKDDFLKTIAGIRALFGDGILDSTWSQIVDFRKVDSFDRISSHDIRQLALQSPWPPGTRRAMIVTDEHSFGLSRMYQMLVGDPGENMALVYSMDDAQAWVLGSH